MRHALCAAALDAAARARCGGDVWSTDLNRPSVELIANEAERFDFVHEKPSVDDLIWSGPVG